MELGYSQLQSLLGSGKQSTVAQQFSKAGTMGGTISLVKFMNGLHSCLENGMSVRINSSGNYIIYSKGS